MARQENAISIYCEIGEFNSLTETFKALPLYNPKEDVLLFFKFYDHKTSTLGYVCHICFPTSTTLSKSLFLKRVSFKLKRFQIKGEVEEALNLKMKFQPKTELMFFEEVRMNEIKPMPNKDQTIEQLGETQLLDGDIYVFQINEKEKFSSYKLPTVLDYFK